MSNPNEALTYPLGAVSRLTGLSPDLLRAWERRYQVVVPLRTSGGTRRYQNSDVERLRLVKAAVDAGHRISEVARLASEELEQRAARESISLVTGPVNQVLAALEQLDLEEADRLTSGQLSALGPTRFAREFGAPLAEALGSGWVEGRVSIAAEHLGTALLRSLLGAHLRPTVASAQGRPILFSTLPEERHELGLLVAALAALGAGGRPLYLGPELPIDELCRAAELKRAVAVAISVVHPPAGSAEAGLRQLREGLPADTEVWVGGASSIVIPDIDGVDRVGCVEELERRVALASSRRR